MTNKILFSRLLAYARPQWGTAVIAVIAMAVVAATEPAVAALMQPMIDGSFIEKDPDTIIMVPLALMGLFLVRGVGRILSTIALTAVATRLVMDIRMDMYQQIQELPQSFMDSITTGKLLSKVTYDVEQLSVTTSHVWMVLVSDTLKVIGLLGFMFYQSWQLSLMMLITAPVIGLIIVFVSKRMRKSSKALQTGMGNLTHRMEEGIKGHKLIRLYGAEKQETEKFRGVTNLLRQNTNKLKAVGACNSPITQFVISIALASVVYIAANLEGESAMTPGAFISFFTAMGMLFSPMRSLTSVTEPFQKGMAAAESIFTLLDEAREQDSGKRELANAKGQIDIEQLSFSYDSQDSPALKDLNLSIKAGETVALVGASGSGKTTLTQLIPRFYSPQQGSIKIDGNNTCDLTLRSLRNQIAYVDQEVLLFDESVAENVAFGDPNGPDLERVNLALRQAHAEQFVSELENGVKSSIGEGGSMLSGGQRQRLALARAFYRQAPILILDEATSALDNESERQVQAALEELCTDKTTIIVAHRLSTIEKADRIVVMDQGEIKEIGTHQQLMAQQGLYRGLYQQMES
ncbi:MAG: lipid A export permease/ATP-binding protein MsbA [Motiliproteus sp.]|nr:lipid A export permease/ATP-binding protein MsbA [Motiliproteus sp.]MCW9053761.1 lipid A export permease/ATP-binding protein MsbA [Motiliproteus sp.]